MAASRAKKLARLVRVQRQMEHMAVNELSFTVHEQGVTDATQQALVEAVGSFNPIHAAMSHQYALRFQKLSAKSQFLAGTRAIQERRVQTERTKADRLEDQADRAAQVEDRLATDESLLELLEGALQRRPQD
ncbi:hypothetical protein PZ897_18210 [Hoeflea sp. YIM 152468]|uniref:hypothetical protein n=1 Tax=Hoeflea sp. YIM 152468 TaxID=3031759 RepID=UPI0023DCB66E|nr:hypothetical protein [Hoeflea sp. YIM 152468]MDF1610120.1 hypothetical protein [Hoeflea sp. YIM 152468]